MATKKHSPADAAGNPEIRRTVATEAASRLDERQRQTAAREARTRRVVDGHPLDPDRLFVGYTILDEGPMYGVDAQLSKALLTMPAQERRAQAEEFRVEMDEATDENRRDGLRYVLTWYSQAEAWLAIECVRKGACHG